MSESYYKHFSYFTISREVKTKFNFAFNVNSFKLNKTDHRKKTQIYLNTAVLKVSLVQV